MCCWLLVAVRRVLHHSTVHQAFLIVRGMAAHDRGWNDSKIDCYSIGI